MNINFRDEQYFSYYYVKHLQFKLVVVMYTIKCVIY